MPQIQVSRSIKIGAPVEKVFSVVSDFNQWTPWSPWLIMEPEATVNVAPDAQYYEWNGKRVGSGNMRITGQDANKSVDYDLTFLTPWKSTAKVRFELTADGEKYRCYLADGFQSAVLHVLDEEIHDYFYWYGL